MNENYPKSLPFDYCLIEVYDICGGDIDAIFKNPKLSTPEANCYRKYCNFPQVGTEWSQFSMIGSNWINIITGMRRATKLER